MLKDFVWRAFESTGNIDTYVFFKEIEEKSRITNERLNVEEEVAISK